MSERLVTDLTLELAAAMAADTTKPEALREFHAAQLKDLRQRAERQRRSRSETPFDRFLEKLKV